MGKGYRVSSFLSWRVNSHPRATQRVPSESPTQELSDGTLNPDLSLNTASAEAKNMKKWTFFKWSWSKGQLAFEGQVAFAPDPDKDSLSLLGNGLCWGRVEAEVGFQILPFLFAWAEYYGAESRYKDKLKMKQLWY